MTSADFNNLLRSYLDGQATPDELKLIDRWYDSLNADVAYQFTPDEQVRLKARMWEQIDARIVELPATETPGIPLNTKPLLAATVWWRRPQLAAAAVVLLLLGSWLLYSLWQPAEPVANGPSRFQGELASLSAGLAERQNNADTAVTLRLADGSTVFLTPRSTLRVARSLATGERLVYLVGDAFFTIAKDARRPFRVITDQIETQVLGTSFWVHAAGKTNKVDVEVATGKVQVYERTRRAGNTHTRGVVLTPNQMVTVTNSEHWQTGLVARPVPISPEETLNSTPPPAELTFNNASLSVVCQRITKTYGIEIDLATADLATCTFSGNIAHQPLYTQLDLLCAAVGAHYDIRGTRILISGRGCPR